MEDRAALPAVGDLVVHLDGLHDLGRHAPRGEHLHRLEPVDLEVPPRELDVEVVEQAGQAPDLLVLTQAPGRGAHDGLGGQAVLEHVGVLHVLLEEGPGFGPGDAGGDAHDGFSRRTWCAILSGMTMESSTSPAKRPSLNQGAWWMSFLTPCFSIV